MLADEKYEFERRLKLAGEYTRSDLKRAFKRSAKACHPDIAKFHGIPVELAEENMKRVNEAYDALNRLFAENPFDESIVSDYNPEGDQVDDGFYIFDDDIYLGAFVQFGRYLLKKDHSFQPLTWYVIDLSDDYATLITDQCIDCRPFHGRFGPINWAASDIRVWLNTVFYDRAFNSKEKEAIQNTRLSNQGTNEYGISGGPDTVDKVYLLSVEEARKLFADWRDLATTGTEFAHERGSDLDSEDRAFWWLRSPGRVPDAMAYIEPGGYIHHYDGRSAVAEGYSVRPVINIRLRKHSHDRIERDVERARKKAAAEKEQAAQKAQKEADCRAKQQAKRVRAEEAQAEENRARAAGYTPFALKPAIGQTVSFGKTPDGAELKWLVLDHQSDFVLLITEQLVGSQPFAHDVSQAEWDESLIRKWLNGAFLNGYFTPTERSAIVSKPVGQSAGTGLDRVFLLSSEEAEGFFTDKASRIATATEYAVANGALEKGAHAWWLRTPGTYGKSFVAAVLDGGKILKMGLSCSASGVAVRPAIWVKC